VEKIEETKPAPPATSGKRQKAGIILLCILIGGALLGGRWWLHSQTHIETDNAFVETHIHSVATRVGGTVKSVLVTDNQLVKKGELILEIDPADYQSQMKGAAAALAMAANETSGEYAKVEVARAEVQQERARLQQADMDLQRGKGLFAKEVIPREQLDRLETAKTVATAQVREKEEQLRRAQAELGLTVTGGKEAKIAQRQAQVEEAALRLSYTRVYAPADGYITKKNVEPGNYVQPGQPLLAVVPLADAWITANYKESQLTRLRPGQAVEFTVDTYGGRKFRGTVESIMAGTGAAFSLLPPENATGNYVKVVQRIPVRIAIDRASDPEHLLRVGMSVVPTVIVERRVGDILKELNPFK
jgi:membrane fusion protein (multidrug efflux system)